MEKKKKKKRNTSLAAPEDSLTACNAVTPAKSKMATSAPQNGRWSLERCLPIGFGHFKQLSLNKFFDQKEQKEEKRNTIMTFIVATNGVASRPPERRPTGTPHACANVYFMLV